ncbi:glycosyltransferase [Fusobacterium mortiferum]|uniref:glycosyltransferase n=2 Tax=Fusobacterium mortiferum TaxID=850 RepID=UPI003566168D
MRILYWIPMEIKDYDGISKKILAQCEALKKLGNEVFLCSEKSIEQELYRVINNEKKIKKCKNNVIYKQIFYWNLNDVIDFIIAEKIELIYIRYVYLANPFFNNFLKKVKEKNRKIILEIPTYPYDGELKNKGILRNIKYGIEKISRNKMTKYIDKIVTYSEDKIIFQKETINLSNGIDVNKISLINKEQKKEISFLMVAGLAFWHGVDRFLYSLLQYRKNGGKEKIKFHIVGEGTETSKLKKIVEDNIELQDIVIFYGFKSGEELDEIYNYSDIAVSSLGFSRDGTEKGSTLKVREYCAKGLPFILGYKDTSFIGNEKFIYNVPNDESLIDISKVIKWYKSLEYTHKEIRKYAEENLSWDNQMRKVLDEIGVEKV